MISWPNEDSRAAGFILGAVVAAVIAVALRWGFGVSGMEPAIGLLVGWFVFGLVWLLTW